MAGITDSPEASVVSIRVGRISCVADGVEKDFGEGTAFTVLQVVEGDGASAIPAVVSITRFTVAVDEHGLAVILSIICTNGL